ncbi:hypothetical protein SAMN06272759_1059 [Novosphingobium sp. B1]|nr:hypothetical protein SAMN06272759_1059 [Novosphingobium sp. B1]
MVSVSSRESVLPAPEPDHSVEICKEPAGAQTSPVHELQARLERFEMEAEISDSDRDSPRGWAIIAWPVGLSLGLWLVIIEVIYAMWSEFVA